MMSDRVSILYNGVDAFYPQPTPLVGLDEQSIYADEKWGAAESLTLQGQLTGCSFDKIVDAQNTLLSRFNKSYQSLEIWQEEGGVSGKVFQKDLVEVKSIQFDQSRWFGVLPYTINLTCYPSGLFSGAFGILNPQDNWIFAEQENATLAVTHSMSCQPFNTSSGPSNALDNARNWAFGRTGISSWVYPTMISGVSPSNFCLLTQTESIDRFNGTYSLTEEYSNDLARNGYGTIRYSAEIVSGDNLITVSLNGSAQGCNRNITGARAAFQNLDKTAIALKQYQSAFNRNDLNPLPTNQTFNENPFTAEVNFAYSYDNSNLPSVWFDYEVGMSVGTDGLITANINGTVYARGGDVASKLSRCQAYAQTINLYDLVLPFYGPFDVSSTVPLNTTPVTNGQSNNESNGTVALNATFNNRSSEYSAFEDFDATVTVSQPVTRYDAQPVLNGLGVYSVVNLGYTTRKRVSVNGSAVVSRSVGEGAGDALVRSAAYSLFGQYGAFSDGVLEVNEVNLSRSDKRVVSFSFVWS
jgi:hypothetical protein